MSTVVFDISVSVDGFLSADAITPEEPLGHGGERLHEWAWGADADRAPRPIGTIGALICGRRTYDASLPWWGADGPHAPIPVFVVTSRPPAAYGLYTFVSDGIEAALDRARAAAGDGHVRIMGGASMGRQYLAAGLVDEVVLHTVPVLFRKGARMFEDFGTEHIGLDVLDVVTGPDATHVHYRVRR